MVEIRKLQPSVKIKMPERPPAKPKRMSGWERERTLYQQRRTGARKRYERKRADHPAPTPQDTPCVLWQGPVDKAGYGVRWFNPPGKTRYHVGLHRWIVEFVLERKLRKDEFVMHLCDNPPCYRYDHLVVGNARLNNHDMMRKGRYVHVANSSPGERNGNAKLKDEHVAKIRRLAEAGWLHTSIAREMKISRSHVSRILRGESRKEEE